MLPWWRNSTSSSSSVGILRGVFRCFWRLPGFSLRSVIEKIQGGGLRFGLAFLINVLLPVKMARKKKFGI